MRYSTLVALAVVVSSTPGLAAPAPFGPNRAKPGPHHGHPDHAAHARAVTSDHHGHPGPHHAHPDHAAHARAVTFGRPGHPGPHHGHPDHAAHARAVTPDHPDHPGHHHGHPDHASHARAFTSDHPGHPGPHHNHPGHAAHARAVSSDILQVIESALDSVKREISPDDYQSIVESLGFSGSGSTIDKRLKLPKISPSTESALEKAANVATIGGGIANIWGNIDGSSSKREETEFDERAFKIPASVASWFKTLGNVGSIGAGGAAVVGALDGGNSTLKREVDQTFDGVDLTTLLDGATSQFEERGRSPPHPPPTRPPTRPPTPPSAPPPNPSTLKHHPLPKPVVKSGRSLISSPEGDFAQLLGDALRGSGGIPIKRSAYDPDPKNAHVLSPEELKQVLAQLNARMVDLD